MIIKKPGLLHFSTELTSPFFVSALNCNRLLTPKTKLMIKAILVEQKGETLTGLEGKIQQYCPQLTVCGLAASREEAMELIAREKPDIAFISIPVIWHDSIDLFNHSPPINFETILVTSLENLPVELLRYGISGCIRIPVESGELLFAVRSAQKRITLKKESFKDKQLIRKTLAGLSGDPLIGIPTMKGFDFFHVEEIIRCEGLHRCTRIVTQTQSNIVSSYHLGEFRKLLKPYAFFSPHRSHLINLHHVKQYDREGTITMADDSNVPVARRKKQEFMDVIIHI